MIKELDDGLRNFAMLLKEKFNKDVAFIQGTGAAGGIAAGLMGFFDVRLKKGVDMVIKASGIIDVLKKNDMLITGEGKIDGQSTQGKVVGRMAQLAADEQIPCIAFCGLQDFSQANDKLPGLQKIISLANEVNDVEYSMKNAHNLLQKKVTEFFSSV
jgi:glycerate kinase